MRAPQRPAWKQWPLPEFGIDLFDWQDGRCAMCGGSNVTRRLVLDHCHYTGLVRGYLCGRCNAVEGQSFDPIWDAWREGDNPANAIKQFEIYRNHMGATPISSQGALHWYSHSERMAWFREVIELMEAGADWPQDAPWIDSAVERRDAAYQQMREVMAGWSFLKPSAKAVDQ